MAKNEVKFNFAEKAESAFSFLKEDDFACSFISPTRVRYESNKVYIDILYGEWDGEVSIFFGRNRTKEEFSFTLFLRLVNPDLERKLGERLAYQPIKIIECLRSLAAALRSEGEAIIDGDDAVFERMKSVRWWDFKREALKQN